MLLKFIFLELRTEVKTTKIAARIHVMCDVIIQPKRNTHSVDARVPTRESWLLEFVVVQVLVSSSHDEAACVFRPDFRKSAILLPVGRIRQCRIAREEGRTASLRVPFDSWKRTHKIFDRL
jgi:hypothetical protein